MPEMYKMSSTCPFTVQGRYLLTLQSTSLIGKVRSFQRKDILENSCSYTFYLLCGANFVFLSQYLLYQYEKAKI